MFVHKISSGPIEDGLDRKHLATLKRRFLEINSARLNRTREALAERQTIFLDLLPLLFHVNHPMLPGYISQDSPCGVALYQPDENSLQAAKKIARSFRYNARHTVSAAVEAIFLMGSVGTIAYSRKSDLDLWICYAPDLPAEAVRQLTIKCQLLTDWATQLGLETHLFLMNSHDFCEGKNHSLSKEASGDTQHYLLLDEFYRSSILVAGKFPIWWFVPSQFEYDYQQYTNTLTNKRFLPDRELISLGSVAHIPETEFIGAGVWQLYKAIEAPYKSVLKLLLLEVYASEAPTIDTMAQKFKQCVYDGELDINQLDPYVACYQRIENYLVSRREMDRLSLLRRCFYFKVNKPLTKRTNNKTDSWQRTFLASLVSDWHWSEKYLAYLDNRANWKAADVIGERRVIVKELNRCYRALLTFERRTKTSTLKHNQDLSILGRKLSAYFERRPEKIDYINAGGVSNLNEEQLCFVHNAHSDHVKKWQLFSERLHTFPAADARPLHREESLLQLMLWAYRNELLTPNTSLHVLADKSPIQESQLFELHDAIARWLPLPLPRVPHESYFQLSYTTDVMIFVNLTDNPTTQFSERGIHRIGGNDDAFNYGAFSESLIMDMSIATKNNWNEISCYQFRESPLPDTIRFLFEQLDNEHTDVKQSPRIAVHCITPHYGNIIKQRVSKLFENLLVQFFASHRQPPIRYIYSEKDAYYCCERNNQQFLVTACTSETQLLSLLAEPYPYYRAIDVDAYTHTASPLALVASVSEDEAIHVIYSPRGQSANIYVIDEKGSLFHYQSFFHNQQLLLVTLHKFLRNAIEQLAIGEEDQQHFGVYPVKFYRHMFDDFGEESLLPSFPTTHTQQLDYNDLQLRVEQEAAGHVFHLSCDGNHFTAPQLDESLFQQLDNFLLTKHEISPVTPCYVTDIAIGPAQLAGELTQTSDYLHLKARIEQRLNTALNAPI